MAVFWSYFRDFVGAQKIEDLTESENFFAELFQIKSRFVLGKKIWGVRCTLKFYGNSHVAVLRFLALFPTVVCRNLLLAIIATNYSCYYL